MRVIAYFVNNWIDYFIFKYIFNINAKYLRFIDYKAQKSNFICVNLEFIYNIRIIIYDLFDNQ